MDTHVSKNHFWTSKFYQFGNGSRFIFTIYLAIVAVFFLPPDLLAAEDLDPPVLTAISVFPATVDVTGGSASVTATVTIKDNLSGLEYGAVYFYSPTTNVFRAAGFNSSSRISGDALNGTYKMTITFPQFSEAGDWVLKQVTLRDVVQNNHNYSVTELDGLGFYTVISVTSIPDITAPSLSAISFSPASVDTSTGSVPVTMTVTISDDLSGYNSGYFYLYSPIYSQYRSFTASASHLLDGGTSLDGTYVTTSSLPQYAESGDWYFRYAYLYDKAGNRQYVSSADIQATINVTSYPEDVQGAVLEEFSFTEHIDTLDGPDTATFTLRTTDNLSGFSHANSSVSSPSGGQRHYLNWGLYNRTEGDALNGTYEFNKAFPRYSEYGEWTISYMYLYDVTTNRTNYSPTDIVGLLENLGLPTTLKISGIKSDGSGNYTVDSAGGTIVMEDEILEVEFPDGAVPDGTDISITSVGRFEPVDIDLGIGTGPGLGNVIAEYNFEPDGLTFVEPVTVTMTIDVTDLNQNQRDRLDVYLRVDTDGDGVEDTFFPLADEQIISVDTITNPDGSVDMVFVIQLEHFSTYAVIEQIVDDTDTVPPTVEVTVPAATEVLQGSITLAATVTDDSSIKSASFTIREVNGEEGLIIGYENIPATQVPGTDNWILADFDSSQLLDGYYLIFATAKDASDNEGTSEVVSFSVRNWSLTHLLPATETNRPGRTMPVKFSMRLDPETDPSMPFVHNEKLEIRIYETGDGDLLQTSRFGVLSTDYRIDNVKEQYITNFKTNKTPSEYLIEIWRTSDSDGVEDVLIDDFNFETEKKK